MIPTQNETLIARRNVNEDFFRQIFSSENVVGMTNLTASLKWLFDADLIFLLFVASLIVLFCLAFGKRFILIPNTFEMYVEWE